MKYYFVLLFCIFLTAVSCSQKVTVDLEEKDAGYIVDNRYHIVKESFIYALLSVNVYESKENPPFKLPEYIREVRHADSRLSGKWKMPLFSGNLSAWAQPHPTP